MALAHLPRDMIEVEFNALLDGLDAAVRRALHPFETYYRRQWLRIITPAGFSVYGLAKRTNNVSESYNSVLATQLGKHPSAWTFMS